MPTTHAHKTFGDLLLTAYPAQLRQRITPHLKLFYIGLHGPDVLMYYNALTKHPVNRLGRAVHKQPARAFFTHGTQVLHGTAADARDAALAYLLGFLGHFALDSVCHSYVERKIQVSGCSHTQIEMEFDRHLLVRQGIDPVKAHLVGHIHPGRAAARVIAPFFPQLTARQVSVALRSMVVCLELLRAPGKGKRWLISQAFRLTGNTQGMGGLVMSAVPAPACADSNLRLQKLMEKALPLCLRLTQNYLEHLQSGAPLAPWFDRTFGPADGWQNIPVYSFREEMEYEAEIDIP